MKISRQVQLKIYYEYLPDYMEGEDYFKRDFFNGYYESIEEAMAVAFSILPTDTKIMTEIYSFEDWEEAAKTGEMEIRKKYISLEREVISYCSLGACISPILEADENDEPKAF